MYRDTDTLPGTDAGTARTRQARPARRILAVDDDRTALMFLEQEIADLGYDVECVGGGREALERLRSRNVLPDVIVLDKRMPDIDGLEVVRTLKKDARLGAIPVVMLTGDRGPDEIREGVDAGVFYYLTKPLDASLLRAVLGSALRDATQKQALMAEVRQHESGFALIDTCRFRFRTLDEAWDLSGFMARCFPDPARVLPGLAELLVNAVEHGNLEIGFRGKAELIRNGMLNEEIERRLALPDYANRTVEAVVTHRQGGICAIITDQGTGFDWKPFLQIDPSRASDINGRGIAKARTLSFDKLAFNETGNQVVGFVSQEAALDW